MYLLEKQWCGDRASTDVCVMEERIEMWEKRISQQDDFFHCCSSCRTEHSWFLILVRYKTVNPSESILKKQYSTGKDRWVDEQMKDFKTSLKDINNKGRTR